MGEPLRLPNLGLSSRDDGGRKINGLSDRQMEYSILLDLQNILSVALVLDMFICNCGSECVFL